MRTKKSRPIVVSELASLHVKTESRTRFVVPVHVSFGDGVDAPTANVLVTMPWGAKAIIPTGDLLAVNGSPYDIRTLCKSFYVLREKRDREENRKAGAKR